MRNRNTPLRAFAGKSPVKNKLKDYAKAAVKIAKPLAGKAAKKALGPVGLLLGATKTATADNVTDPKTGVNRYTGKKTYPGGSMF
tara:strand:+ start:970 stop:1224 length:255 start_codon:yes stop_codon:yes gene_type:complete